MRKHKGLAALLGKARKSKGRKSHGRKGRGRHTKI